MPSTTARAVLSLLLVTAGGAPSFAAPPLDRVLPPTTRASFTLTDLTALRDGWQRTRLSRLSDEPAIKPFLDDAERRFEEQLGALRDVADIGLEDLREAAAGEVRLATIDVSAGQPASAMLAEVAEGSTKVAELIAKIDAGLARRGAAHATETVGDITLHTYRWTSPGGRTRRSAYFIKDDTLVVASETDVAKQLLSRFAGVGDVAGSLADTAAYQNIAERMAAVGGETPVQVRWFIDPLKYQQLVTGMESGFAKRHGLDGVQGIGGTVSFGLPKYDILSRVFIYAPETPRGVLRMARLQADLPLAPPAWLTADVDSYAVVNVKLDGALDDVAPLFDELAADGIEGTFNDILSDLKSEDGPGIDVRKELMPLLGPRLMIVSDHAADGDSDSGQTLIALTTSDEAATADAVERLMRDDPQVKRVELPGYMYPLWQVKDADDSTFPNMGMMVAQGQLLAASDGALIRKTLTAAAGEAPRLANAADYQQAAALRQELGGASASLWLFSRTRRDYHATYSMARAGKLDDLESAYGDILRSLFGDDKDRLTGLPKLDFTKLPPFTAVEPYLNTMGAFVINQPGGWMIVGFTPAVPAAP